VSHPGFEHRLDELRRQGNPDPAGTSGRLAALRAKLAPGPGPDTTSRLRRAQLHHRVTRPEGSGAGAAGLNGNVVATADRRGLTSALRRVRRASTRADGAPPILDVTGLTKRFGGLQALSDVSFRVHEGEIVGLIGPNGSGKTTTFNCISGVHSPTDGDVRYRDRSLLRLNRQERARLGIGRTFQQLQLCPSLSVEENLVFGAEAQTIRSGFLADALLLPSRMRASRERAERANHLVRRFELEEVRDRPAGAVPIGVGRLTELGRALGARPSLLLLDEPSSGLDPAETAAFGQILVEALEGADPPLTMLLVEHDMSLVMAICDYLYVLDFGRLIAEGTPEEVRRNAAVRDAYLGTKAAAVADSPEEGGG